jgi:hypothetical protein
MASKFTQAVAARVPNQLAAAVREYAEQYGLTTSDVVGTCIRVALGRSMPESFSQDDDPEAVRA